MVRYESYSDLIKRNLSEKLDVNLPIWLLFFFGNWFHVSNVYISAFILLVCHSKIEYRFEIEFVLAAL